MAGSAFTPVTAFLHIPKRSCRTRRASGSTQRRLHRKRPYRWPNLPLRRHHLPPQGRRTGRGAAGGQYCAAARKWTACDPRRNGDRWRDAAQGNTVQVRRLSEQTLLRQQPHQSRLRRDRRARLEGVQPLAARNGALKITPQHNGCLKLEGNLEIVSGTGRTIDRATRAFLCRCGQSKNKPFCDGSHKTVGFVG